MSSENLQKNEMWYLPATNTWNKSIEIPEIWLVFTIPATNILFKTVSQIEMSSENLEDFKHFPRPIVFRTWDWREAVAWDDTSL